MMHICIFVKYQTIYKHVSSYPLSKLREIKQFFKEYTNVCSHNEIQRLLTSMIDI